MCFIRPEHFTGVLLFVYTISYTSSNFFSFSYAASLNTSEEIKHLFNGDHGVKDTTMLYSKGIPRSNNFAEGGLLNVNISPTTVTASPKKNASSSSQNNSAKKNLDYSFNSFKNKNDSNYKNNTLNKLSATKTLVPSKLNDTGSNLFLGVPEVIHINGTSSIKPRKGVYFNKIVPRKGVENDSEANHNGSDYLCVWLGENECYSSKEFNDANCKCCKQGNALGKTIKHNYSVSCKNCKPVILEFPDDKHICENICCYDKFHDASSISNTQNIFYKNLSLTAKTEINNINSSSGGKIKESNNGFTNLSNSFRQKPNITKVPYDVEVVTEILSKSKQKVFVPVIVSLLLLPLFGILVFVVLRKTKEIWDKRYYKRMDFLIDGMYQD